MLPESPEHFAYILRKLGYYKESEFVLLQYIHEYRDFFDYCSENSTLWYKVKKYYKQTLDSEANYYLYKYGWMPLPQIKNILEQTHSVNFSYLLVSEHSNLQKWADANTGKDSVQHIFVINLQKRKDRWNRFLENWYRMKDVHLLPEPQRFVAIDGNLVKPHENWMAGPGAWGCYRSHMNIIEHAIQCKYKNVLILEDDAYFIDGFVEKTLDFLKSVPYNWEQLYLGGQHLKKPEEHKNGVLKCHNVNRTHAYMLRNDFMLELYHHLLDIDSQHKKMRRKGSKLKGFHIDHWMGEIHSKKNVYAPVEWLIGQDEGVSDICVKHLKKRMWNRKK